MPNKNCEMCDGKLVANGHKRVNGKDGTIWWHDKLHKRCHNRLLQIHEDARQMRIHIKAQDNPEAKGILKQLERYMRANGIAF